MMMKAIQINEKGEIEPEEISPEEERFLSGWKPTQENNEKDIGESLRLAARVKAVPTQCWFNARKAVLKLKDYADASYVEGWMVFKDGLAIEHAWVVKDGEIIDPTLPVDEATYFPGLEFQGKAGIEEFLETPQGKKVRKSPYFYAFGWSGSSSPSFSQSFCKAMALVRAGGAV
jgi:hypothetical protein